jgi:hypothetical protein
MSTVRRWLRRVWYFVNRRRLERELEFEMTAHRAAMGDPRGFGNLTRLRIAALRPRLPLRVRRSAERERVM